MKKTPKSGLQSTEVYSTSMDKIRLAIIGLGRFATYHAKVWKQHQHVQVVALCDRNEESLRAYSTVFPEAKCYMDAAAMLDAERIDAVDILTSEHTHHEIVKLCLEANTHVFVEKPLTTDVDSSKELIRLAEQQGRLLMVGHVLRFDPRYHHVKKEIESGHLGAIHSIYARRNNAKAFFHIYKRVPPVFILGIHDIDIMHWLTEDRVYEVFAAGSSDRADIDKSDNLLWAMLKFNHGMIGVVENHWLLPDGAPAFADVRMEVVGDEGMVQLQDPDQTLNYYTSAKINSPSVQDWNEVYGQVNGPLVHELNHFIDCIRLQCPSDILRPIDALEAVRVAQAIVESVRTGRPVHVKDV